MKTLLYMEDTSETGANIWFRLNKNNLLTAPKGIIRIARYETIFYPSLHQGYYGDIYMKGFIRKWKRITMEKSQCKKGRVLAETYLCKKLCYDVLSVITQYL
jgi:hypothetical protein